METSGTWIRHCHQGFQLSFNGRSNKFYGRLLFNNRRPFNSAKVWGHCPTAGPGQRPDNNNHININIFGVSYQITIKSQPQVLIKWFLIKKQRVYQTYDMKYLNAAGK